MEEKFICSEVGSCDTKHCGHAREHAREGSCRSTCSMSSKAKCVEVIEKTEAPEDASKVKVRVFPRTGTSSDGFTVYGDDYIKALAIAIEALGWSVE